jgi:hypothetical protein
MRMASSPRSRPTRCHPDSTRTWCAPSRGASASPSSCCAGAWQALAHWRTLTPPRWGRLRVDPIDFQALSYYAAPKSLKDGPKSLAEVDPKLLETYEKLGVPLHERARLAGVAVDAVFDSVSVGTTFREQLAAVGVIFCSFSHAVEHHPELIERYLGSVVPPGDNFYAALNSAAVLRRLLRLRARGRALPDGAVVLLPHQCAQHRAVRAHPHHCRGRQPGQLPRRLHRATARRAPAARRRGGADRARRRRHQVLDGAELVPGRCAGARRHLQLRDQARAVRGAPLAHRLDADRDRFRPSPGSTPVWCCAATIRAASSIRSRCRTTISRPTPAPR